jgi:hypothetical protein
VDAVASQRLWGPIYRRAREVPRAKYLRREITARQRLDGRLRRLGSSALVHWHHSRVKLGRIWPAPVVSTERISRAHRRQRARSALLRPRRRFCSAPSEEDGHAEAQGGVGGAERRRTAGLAPAGRHGRFCHRGRGRSRRDSSPPTLTTGQEAVRRPG